MAQRFRMGRHQGLEPMGFWMRDVMLGVVVWACAITTVGVGSWLGLRGGDLQMVLIAVGLVFWLACTPIWLRLRSLPGLFVGLLLGGTLAFMVVSTWPRVFLVPEVMYSTLDLTL